MIPGDGKIGEIYHYINGKFDWHQRVYKISTENKNFYLKFFYFYFQKSLKKYLLSFSVKATVDSIRLPMLQNYTCSIPSFFEQQKIAHFFSLIDKQIELWERKLELTELFLKYYLARLFTNNSIKLSLRFKNFESEWFKSSLVNLTIKIKSGGTPRSTNKSYYDGDIPFLSISDFQGKFLNKTKKHVNLEAIKNSSTFIAPKNKLLLSIYATVGLPIITKIDVAIPQSIAEIDLKDERISEFLYYYFLFSKKMISKIISNRFTTKLKY